MWPITNHKNNNAFLGTTFICLDIQVCQNTTIVPASTLATIHQ
ncbi:unnamed protein product [Brassica napus]|uniref:(rape) hypothetical protein n=1 Tax=Brassica napus TaxID=3708 RepID=A0A816JZH7_BRANA|nr:unnamed protein product [Brassica napus]